MFAGHVVATPAMAVVRVIMNFLEQVEVKDEDRWQSFSDSLPPARFIVWIANEVTTDLLAEQYHIAHDLAELVLAVHGNASGSMQYDAERFIRQRYGKFHFHREQCRAVLIFRELVQHKLRLQILRR